jgi:hypothetical protein
VSDRRLAEAGLSEAIDRLRFRLDPSNEGDPLIPLAETMEWLYRLERFHVKRLSTQAFKETRSGSRDGLIEEGLVWARGRYTHSLVPVAHLVTVSPGNILVSGGPPRSRIINPPATEYRWRPAKEIPGRNTRKKASGQVSYTQNVEGLPILRPIEAARRFITGLSETAGSPCGASSRCPAARSDAEAAARH